MTKTKTKTEIQSQTVRNQKIHVDKVASTIVSLKNLKTKPKSKLTLREVISALEIDLRNAISKGYSNEDLAQILAKQDIFISAATLKQYLKDLNAASKSRRKRKIAPVTLN